MGWSSLEMGRERLSGGNGNSKVRENNTGIWIDSDGFLHRADDCRLQITVFVSYSTPTFYKKETMYKSVGLEGTMINLAHVWHIYSFVRAVVDESGQTTC